MQHSSFFPRPQKGKMQSAKGVKIIHKKKSDGKIEGKTTANRRKHTHTKGATLVFFSVSRAESALK